jgi:hypothetical protein
LINSGKTDDGVWSSLRRDDGYVVMMSICRKSSTTDVALDFSNLNFYIIKPIYIIVLIRESTK